MARHRPTGAAPRPRGTAELRHRFEDCGFRQEQIPNDEQARLLVRLLNVYDDKDLFGDGCPAPLCQICRNAHKCWADAEEGERREPPRPYGEDDEDGSVMLPWVGRAYDPGGVVVVGINPNIDKTKKEWSELFSEHSITWNRGIPILRAGLKRDGGSAFGYRALRWAAALLDDLDGKPPRRRRPKGLIDVVHRIARVQAIKCVPRRKRSEPYEAMWEHCPSMLLAGELDVLKPSRLLVLGNRPYDAIADVGTFAETSSRSLIKRGVVQRSGWCAEVYGMTHPATRDPRRVIASEDALFRLLRA
jgi:hypothetical protein